jgi:aryl-alcohol dehydrogenase-like predicted oxidoreductase
VLPAAAAADINVITRVVDYGGLLFDDLGPDQELPPRDHRRFRPPGWIEAGRRRMTGMREIGERRGLTTIQTACQWNLAHGPVQCVVPTLIQELGDGGRPVADKRAELAALPRELRLSEADVDRIRALGDNTGSMALKGASPVFSGEERPDAWALDARLGEVARRWGIEPERDLTLAAA